MSLLLVYASTYGQTEAIVRRIAVVAGGQGATVTLVAADRLRGRLEIAPGSLVVIAGSVKWGRHQRSIVRFVRRHRDALTAADTVFVSVSGAASAPAGLAQAREYADKFVADTGWTPGATALFAGGMAFSRMNWLMRRIMIVSDRRAGRMRDPSRDYDYTDWDEVDRFARELASRAVREPLPATRSQ